MWNFCSNPVWTFSCLNKTQRCPCTWRIHHPDPDAVSLQVEGRTATRDRWDAGAPNMTAARPSWAASWSLRPALIQRMMTQPAGQTSCVAPQLVVHNENSLFCLRNASGNSVEGSWQRFVQPNCLVVLVVTPRVLLQEPYKFLQPT